MPHTGSPKCILIAVKLSFKGSCPMPARLSRRSILSKRLEVGEVRRSEKYTLAFSMIDSCVL